MSLRVISYDDACSLTRVWDAIQISNMPIFKEASENGLCKIISNNNTSPVSIEILIMDDTIDKNVVGFLVCFHKNEIDVYLAKEYSGEIVDGEHVCKLNLDASLASVIAKAQSEINKCPICGKSVTYSEQNQFSFAGRCCKDCLPKMKEKYEKPGWYN